ncbi:MULTISPECIES: sulfatase family protein [Sphingobium]|uniref:N-acetylgalactosamine-6-sulfatase n=1 Tax=Sphingobium fuliginis (strain ATCC 27551) TaxID=336203 RepID=A0ABQ1F1R9_SPHSA|nr:MULTISPECIES: sulfatase-like hydrolase/transferase [Sphingobium]RYL97245.1 arylsulfatase [Sphingobium fuliginis]WDA35659.1 sulfatase-like hydrolase/transferase [Sphingobium sp. YC-XJ3]GFZ96197.1 N-acetylgalactosamine-6-sulfatase [Sphingobium fuliginis]
MKTSMTGAMTRRAALAALGSAVAAPAVARGGRSGPRRPNILYIMADDMGHADLGCYGSRNIRTPAIDAMAARGVKFGNAYANSCVCSPTRVALLTGRYQGRFRIGLEEPIAFNGAELSLPRGTRTLPGLLRDLGYTTSLVGKWHMGELPASSPLDHGYDYFFGIASGGTDYFAHATSINGHEMGKLFENRTEIDRPGYLTDLLGAKAIDRMQQAARKERPFFISLHFTAPHWPWQGPGDAAQGSATADPRQMDGGNVRAYAAMMESMDANVGRVLAELARLGLEEDTIVIFTSDNGGERFSDSWPLTGMKGELLEGGIRVPLIVSWPAHLPQGRDSAQVTMSMDALPTLLSAAGGDPDRVEGLDGIDLMPFLRDVDSRTDRTLFWRHRAGDQIAVRSGQWKYLRSYGRDYLFDLSQDERERADRKAAMPGKVAELKAAHAGWLAQMLPYPEHSYSEDMLGKFADRPGE